MSANSKGRELFIVDNSVSGWTGLSYLEEWTKIATGFDIATGYFEIGSLLSLDGRWQNLNRIRILMGAETTPRTRSALLKAVSSQVKEKLNTSIEQSKESNPFLHGVPDIVDALHSGKIECRVFDKAKFHAKAYITHATLEVVGSQALVGSSNFTKPGLTNNVELNVQVQSAREVAQLQEWFEEHWNEATEISEMVLETVVQHTKSFTPYDVYTKALHEFFRGHELTATEWDEQQSRIFARLDHYQKEAYWALLKIVRQHGGAFLCDGVGLGKTFVGLMLIERLILREGKRVVLFAPKATREGVWEPHLRTWLPHIGGSTDFSNLAVFNHTDLGRGGNFPERFRRIAELADVVIIDEAHHFRNPGRRGDPKIGLEPSRYYRLFDLLDTSNRPKTLFMLTATPINNHLTDFRHMTELFTRRDEKYFARTLGINNLRSHFNQMERVLRQQVGEDGIGASEHMSHAEKILFNDEIFQRLVVQRSRSYTRKSQVQEHGQSASFPERMEPRVANYSIKKSYGRMLELIEKAFAKEIPLFTLPMYYPLHWYIGEDSDIDPFEQNRQKQVVGLIRTNFLKRFESSVVSFELSCDRLLKKLLAFLKVHSESDGEKNRLERWTRQNAESLSYTNQRSSELWGEEKDLGDDEDDEDIVPQELLSKVLPLSREEYDVESMMSETFLDLDQIVQFLDEARKFKPAHDDKLQELVRLQKSEAMVGHKILVFTEFADTARYLKRHLDQVGIDGVEQVDSATKKSRVDIVQRFAPYYNSLSSPELAERNREEIRVLISTDVLSEGLNLQDASRVVNYDIHWNPVRLLQRIGRVDRRMNDEIEKRLLVDHPELAPSRGKVWFWNFLPPNEIDRLLKLYNNVTQKTLLISRTFGIEGKKLLTPDDDYDALREFNHVYEGTRTAVEELHLEYQALLSEDSDLQRRLDNLPGAIFSGRKRPKSSVSGVFFCYALPAHDKESNEFTEDAGTTHWYFYDFEHEAITDDPGEIAKAIRSNPGTKRVCLTEESTLLAIRKQIEREIKNTYLKRVDAPIGIKPRLLCWMELNDG